VLYDRASDSIWYPEENTLKSVGGSRMGQSIEFRSKPDPIALTEWVEAHPTTQVLLPSEEDAADYNRPFLGVSLEPESTVVREVVEDSPAAAAGFEAGDQLLNVAGTPIDDLDGLREALGECEVGQQIEVVVQRGETKKSLQPLLVRRGDS
jgi:S1-C subfamily serine protease